MKNTPIKKDILTIPWVVTTCDQYKHLMPEFAIRFNEFVGPYKIDVLCFEKPSKLPNNFNVISLGKQKDYGKIYTDPLIPYFENLSKKNEYFFYLLDDYYIAKPMKHQPIKEVFDYCTMHKIKIDKIDLSDNISSHSYQIIEGTNIVKADNMAIMKTCLQAACWRTNYYRELLKPNLTIWECEAEGSLNAEGDGANILGFKDDLIPLEYFNEYHLGKKRKRGRKKQRRQKQYRKKMAKNLIKYIMKNRDPQEIINCLLGDEIYNVEPITYQINF